MQFVPSSSNVAHRLGPSFEHYRRCGVVRLDVAKDAGRSKPGEMQYNAARERKASSGVGEYLDIWRSEA
jgi:hypothetical protein